MESVTVASVACAKAMGRWGPTDGLWADPRAHLYRGGILYRHCISCSEDLGLNAVLEAFPVGRTVAFDSSKGRLWAVCSRCGRWNLAPLEERWEAVEGGEQRFRTARRRVHRENIGLAWLDNGVRLIRVGEALPREFAAWRYGSKLHRRLRRSLALTAGAAAVGLGAVSGSAAAVVALPIGYGWILADGWLNRRRAREVLHLAPSGGDPRPLRRREVSGVTLSLDDRDELVALLRRRGADAIRLTGSEARALLGRVLPRVNPWGGSGRTVRAALDLIASVGLSEDYLRERGQSGVALALPEAGSRALDIGQLLRLTVSARYQRDSGRPSTAHPAISTLALEIALSEDNERRALDGELRMLANQWREAEEIASIADTLPDDPLQRWLRDTAAEQPSTRL